MLKKTVDAFDVENLCFRLKCAVNSVDAIRLAMFEGPVTPETFDDALYAATTYLYELVDEMAKMYIAAPERPQGGVNNG